MDRDLLEALPIAVSIFLVRFIAAEAVYQRPQRTGQGIRFPAGFGMRVVCRLGGPLMLYTAYRVLSEATTNFDRGLSIVLAAIALGGLLGEPGPITATADGVVQTARLGLSRKSIPWSGAVARYVHGLKEVTVIGNDGTTITHSQYHVAQAQFIDQLKQHDVYVQGFDPRFW